MKTTAQHFTLFRDTCLALAAMWSLQEWEIRVVHGYAEKKDKGDYLACVDIDYDAHLAIVFLSPDWHGRHLSLTDEAVIETARHEMLHIFLAPLTFTKKYQEAGEHAVIQKLLKLL